MSDNYPQLEIRKLCRLFKSGDSEFFALDNVDLKIWPGQFIAIMGQSGSGKTTLMNILGCLDTASSGEYYIDGQKVVDHSPDSLAALRREKFGFIFQRYNLISTLNARENVELPAIYAGQQKEQFIKRCDELLSDLGLPDRDTHLPSQLSGGQQQRIAIARSLINDPPIILADEPTGALDSASGAEVMQLLKSLNQQGRTIILITHDEKVASFAQSIIKIADGKIQNQTQPSSLDSQSKFEQINSSQSGNQNPKKLQDIKESVKMALRSLRINLFRTMLTLLGIIIGVASVITMLAVGSGSKAKVMDQISSMGTNLLSVRPGAPGIRGGGDIVTLIPADAEAIAQIPYVSSVAPERNSRLTARYGNLDYATNIQGVGESYSSARDWPPSVGNFFTDSDVKSFAAVALLGQTVFKNLLPYESNPIGKFIIIKNVPFEIIGVMSSKGASTWGNDQDDAIFIPYTTGNMRLFGKNYLNGITVKVDQISKLDETQKTIESLLKTRHRTEDFNVRNMASLISMASETQNTLTILLGTVAAISLLVGGIGVMNIMLVSVSERTREIGIRMAIGARRRDISLQFITEAAVVCFIGGILGVIFALLIGTILPSFGMEVKFSLAPIVLAFSCAVGTGLLFGYLPARKAANLDPVVALSAE